MPDQRAADALKARFLLVALCLCWGLSWPAMKIALGDIPPIGMRAASTFIGAIALFAIAIIAGRTLRITKAKTWWQIFVVSIFNVVIFSLCSAFAQLNATTSRVTILAYTMPIWACLLAGPILGEYMSRTVWIALGLCCAGLAILIYPLTEHGIPFGILLALGCAWSWSAGTIYMKKVRIDADPIAVATWQLAMGCLILAICVPIFEGSFHVLDASNAALFSLAFSGIFGSGLAYFLWFHIIKLLPAMTASLGAQASPVVGVLSSALILGERPTSTDIIGFALILAASICILVQPHEAEVVQPGPT